MTFVLFKCFDIKAQKKQKQFLADSIFIYKEFNKRGTTANLWHYHRDLDSINAEKRKLDTNDLNEFISIFKNAQRQKLFQQKYGGDICYTIVYNKGIKKTFVFLSSDHFARLDNLVDMQCWTLKDHVKQKQLYDLIRKNWP